MPGWFIALLEAQTPLLFVVILRLAVGGILVSQGLDKVRQGYVGETQQRVEGQDHRLEATLKFWMGAERSIYWTDKAGVRKSRTVVMFPWYRVFLNKAVIPNIKVFAALVLVAELALGALLILGLLTRIASVFAILLLLNYLFATWHMGFPYTALNVLVTICLFIVAIAGAGRCLGLDQFLHNRFPEIPLF